MADWAVLVAASQGGLDEVARRANCTIDQDTVRQCDSLSGFKDPQVSGKVHVNTGASWVALATVN